MGTFADRVRGVVRPDATPGCTPAHEADPKANACERLVHAGHQLSVRSTDHLGLGRACPAGGSQGLADAFDHTRTPPPEAPAVLGGEWQVVRGQRFLVVDREYHPDDRHGDVPVADAMPLSAGTWPRLSMLAGEPCDGGLLFLDLETTGLTGGAGTHAFLVGCAWFRDGRLRIRQLLLPNAAAERRVLEAVADLAAGAGVVVTYNGKSFDLPLIETRFLYHRMATPFAGIPHIDMLHPARRLWGGVASAPAQGVATGCRLTTLERGICGFVRAADVEGFEIPSRYFQFVRTGDSRPLRVVLEHNRLDLLSLALLTARVARLLECGPAYARSLREVLGLGRLYERCGLAAEALACYARVSGVRTPNPLPSLPVGPRDGATIAEALRSYAILCRRQRRYEEAAAAWKRAVGVVRCPPHILREAAHALAVHHEHRSRDLHAARRFAQQSAALTAAPRVAAAMRHRLARLERKLGISRETGDPTSPRAEYHARQSETLF